MKGTVIYYSRTGNTKIVAEKISSELSFELVEIRDIKNRKGALGWLNAGKDATFGVGTKIVPEKLDLSEFTTVILCTPVWSFAPAPALVECVRKNALKGKEIYLVLTSNGMPGNAAKRFRKEVLSAGGDVKMTKNFDSRVGIESLKKTASEFAKEVKRNLDEQTQPTE